MLIGIIGENCSGKSTLAAYIRDVIGAEIITGKDYLRMAKSEQEAKRLFQNKQERRAKSREEKLAEAERLFALKQQKKREKHKGH